MRPWLELLGRRGWFLGLYGIIALTVGVLNAWMTDMLGLNALQWLLLSATRWHSSTASGGDALIKCMMLTGGIAPLMLIGLALLRGRRIGNPYLVVFPVLGLFVTLLGAFPYIMANLGNETIIMGATVITWIFDGACLRFGSREPDSTTGA